MKSRLTPLATSTTMKGPYRLGAASPRSSATKAADASLSRAWTMVWFSCTATRPVWVERDLDVTRVWARPLAEAQGQRLQAAHGDRVPPRREIVQQVDATEAAEQPGEHHLSLHA